MVLIRSQSEILFGKFSSKLNRELYKTYESNKTLGSQKRQGLEFSFSVPFLGAKFEKYSFGIGNRDYKKVADPGFLQLGAKNLRGVPTYYYVQFFQKKN